MFYLRKPSPKRKVARRRKPAQPIKTRSRGPLGAVKRFFLSFTPRYFKRYWISKGGLVKVLSFFGVLFLFGVGLLAWYAKDLPNPNKINSLVAAQTTKFYDRTGTHLLYELFGDQNRSVITFDQMPKSIKNATVAIEDKDFYKHGAFSLFGIGRALSGVITGVNKGGGSTITQQYVKNTLLTNERSYSRKIKELILSVEIEQFYTKDTILKLYLNEIPYGNRAYGIESACKTYFPQDVDKADQLCAKNLDTGQAAILAAIPNAPTYYNPYGANTAALVERQHLILDAEASQGMISKAEALANKWDETKLVAERNPVQNLYGSLDGKVAHFVLYTQDYLTNEYGSKTVTEGGLKVITTLDWDKQMAANDAIQTNYKAIINSGGSNAAMVVTDPKTGQMLAMIGSHDFNDPNGGQVNVAADGLRQPGSSFKPIVYSTLFATNKDAACAKDRTCPTYGPGTTLYDAVTNFGSESQPYTPTNYANRSYGILTARTGIAGSLNVPAVKSLYMAGVDSSLDTASRLGITTLNAGAANYGLSLVLGSGEVHLTEMANAYESFANGGMHYTQTPILKVTDPTGKIIEDNTTPAAPKQALDPQVAFLMADILSDNNAKRPFFFNDLVIKNMCGNNQATNCIHDGVKTGTTENFRDAWTIGFTNELVAGVWVGNNDNSPMRVAAGDIAAPVWVKFMNTVYAGKTSTPGFDKPKGIQQLTLDKKTGRLPNDQTTDKTFDFFPSWYVPMSATSGKSAIIDKISKKLATSCTPDLAKQTVFSSAIVPEISPKDPEYIQWLAGMVGAGLASNGTPIPTDADDVHACTDTQPTAKITDVTHVGSTYTVSADIALGTFGTVKSSDNPNVLTFYMDDQIIATQNISASNTYVANATPTPGSHTFKVVIIDSGLYQATDSSTVTTVATSPTISPTVQPTPHP